MADAALPGASSASSAARNYTLKAFDIAAGLEVMIAFYARRLPDAERSAEGNTVKLSRPGGFVRLTHSGPETRIILAIGPR